MNILHYFSVTLLLLFLLSPANAGTIIEYTLLINVDPYKPSGKPWDVAGGKPDIMVELGDRQTTPSTCWDTYRCIMKFTSNHKKWYFEISDRDYSVNDLIGMGKCGVNENCKLGRANVRIENR